MSDERIRVLLAILALLAATLLTALDKIPGAAWLGFIPGLLLPSPLPDRRPGGPLPPP